MQSNTISGMRKTLRENREDLSKARLKISDQRKAIKKAAEVGPPDSDRVQRLVADARIQLDLAEGWQNTLEKNSVEVKLEFAKAFHALALRWENAIATARKERIAAFLEVQGKFWQGMERPCERWWDQEKLYRQPDLQLPDFDRALYGGRAGTLDGVMEMEVDDLLRSFDICQAHWRRYRKLLNIAFRWEEEPAGESETIGKASLTKK